MTVAGIVIANTTPFTLTIDVQGATVTIRATGPIEVTGGECRPGPVDNSVVCSVTPGARLNVNVAGLQRVPQATPLPALAVAPAAARAPGPAALPRVGTGQTADSEASAVTLIGLTLVLAVGAPGLLLVRRRSRR